MEANNEIVSIHPALKEAVLEAGRLTMERFGQQLEASQKEDGSYATELDHRIEESLRRTIESLYPGHGILGEESGIQNRDREHLWIIDPIDGTHNFMRGLGWFGISVGYAHRGELKLGLVYLPAEDALYEAVLGGGAFRNGQPIHTGQREDLSTATVGFDSSLKPHTRSRTDLLARITEKCFNIRIFGATCVMLTYLAEGRIDAIVEISVKSWDFAGGAVIAREAGAVLIQPDGEAFSIESESYLAGHPAIVPQLLRCIPPEAPR